MPITSHQMSGMIGGQQAMFGNFASYAQQISPGFQGQAPGYSNPMSGAGGGFAPPPAPMQDPRVMGMGPQAVSAIGNIGLPALGTAAMLGGSMLPGKMGSAIGNLDPFSAGLGGFSRGAGLRAGGAGILSNMGRIASGGIGSVARAGLAGIGAAGAAAALPMAVGAVAQYGVGQAVQGAQFQNQVQGVLNQNFRFQNPQSRSGYGFSREQGAGIADMVREMGHSEMMTGPQELLRVMKSGTQQGLFRAVQDVKEFKKRFTDMVGSLKEVAKTMNTTLEGAMPFFSQARQMGFWTPNDITRHAQQARQTAGATGMSVAQTQQMMAQGSQMARSVGAMGAAGAQGMAQSMGLVGGGLRSGAISSQLLSEATGGLRGPEAIQSLGGTLQAATTKFASSRRARWMLASMGRDGFTSLDPGKMQDMMSGTMGLRDISKDARGNIRRQGAFNFVNNEKELRGELIKQGPMAQLGFIRTMIGERLYGDDPKSKLITRRLMKRNFGISGKQADLVTKLARSAPQIMQANEARGAVDTDQQEREQYQMMEHSWEGVRRKASTWFDKEVKEKFQKFGAEMSKRAGDYIEKSGDALWGATPKRHRFRGISGNAMEALQRGAMGDTGIMEQTFGKAGDFEKQFGSPGATGLGETSTSISRLFQGRAGVATNDKIDAFLKMGAKETYFKSQAERDEAVRSGRMVSGTTSRGSKRYGAFEKSELDSLSGGLGAGIMGKAVSQQQASGLGFSSVEGANTAIEGAREEMGSVDFRRAATSMALRTGTSGRELGGLMVEGIGSGKMEGVSASLRKYVMGGKTKAERIHRLAAAQSQRGKRGGIDLQGEAKEIGLGAFTGSEDLEKRIGEGIENAEQALANAVSPRSTAADEALDTALGMPTGGGAGVDGKTIADVARKGGDKFKRAMMLLSSGDNPEDKKVNREKAQEILQELSEDPDMSSQEAKALVSMGDDNNPNAAAIRKSAAALGDMYKFKNRAEFTEVTRKRFSRFFTKMGDRQINIMAAADKVKGGGKSIGKIVRELEDAVADPKKYNEKMAELVAVAGEANADEVAEIAQGLSEFSGGENIVAALRGGRTVNQRMEALTGNRKGRVTAANDLMGDALGTKRITRRQMDMLMGKNETRAAEAMDEIVAKAPEEKQERARQLVESMRSTDKSAIEKHARAQATAQADGTLADPKHNVLLEAMDTLKDKGTSILGHLGSKEGMHVEMTTQTQVLRDIKALLGKEKGTGNETEEV